MMIKKSKISLGQHWFIKVPQVEFFIKGSVSTSKFSNHVILFLSQKTFYAKIFFACFILIEALQGRSFAYR